MEDFNAKKEALIADLMRRSKACEDMAKVRKTAENALNAKASAYAHAAQMVRETF